MLARVSKLLFIITIIFMFSISYGCGIRPDDVIYNKGDNEYPNTFPNPSKNFP